MSQKAAKPLKLKKKAPAGIGVKLGTFAKKNAGPVFILACIAVFTLYVMFSTPRTKEQADAEENMQTTTTRLYAVGAKARNDMKIYGTSHEGRQAATELWGSFSQWERKSTIKKVADHLEAKDFQTSITPVLNSPNLARLFVSANPDLHDDIFTEEAAPMWDLLDSWIAGVESTKAAMGEDAFDALDTSVGYGFWSGMEIFSEYDKRQLSMGGWHSVRSAMLGRFFKRFKTHMAENVATKAAGGELEFPEEPEPEPQWKDEEDAQDIAHLNDATFDESVSSKTHAIVMFYAPWCGHCKKFKPDFGKAATLLKDYDVVIGAVDATESKSRKTKKQFTVEGFPTIYHLVDGKEAGKFEGDRSVYGILEFLADESRIGSALADLAAEHKPPPVIEWEDEENDVAHLNDENFKDEITPKKHAIVMFYAPWCGHCKAFKPGYGDAATQMKDVDEAMVAAVDVTKNRKLGEEYEIKGFPTTLYFENGAMVEKYEEARTTDGVVNYLNKKMGKEEL